MIVSAACRASGKGDPYFTGFDQRVFEFMGQPGTMYNLISERHHQVGSGPLSASMFCQRFRAFGCPWKELCMS